MKKISLSAIVLAGAMALTGCSGSGSASDNCPVFGEVPALYADYDAQRDKIRESESDHKVAQTKIDELKEQYRAKIEAAGKSLDGKPIEVASSDDFKVEQPLSLTFKEFANGLNSAYTVNGEVVAAKDVAFDVSESWLKSHDVDYLMLPLMLTGLDKQGAELTSVRIGSFKGFKVADGKVILPAGTKAELQDTYYNKNDYDNLSRVKSVALTVDTKPLR